jgi:hypothetical protein
LATSPACACSQENLQGGGDNSAFTDPDNQVKNFGGRAHGPNSPVVSPGPIVQSPRRLGLISTVNETRKQLPDDPAVERAAGAWLE